MGMHQYSDHAGMRDGRSMSGARLWAEAEAEREAEYLRGIPNKMGSELALLHDVAASIYRYVPQAAKVIDLGPGTLRAFRKKTLPLVQALNSSTCLIVDKSAAFLHDIKVGAHSAGVNITPIEADFFLGNARYQEGDEPALVCAFGGIISNLIAPISPELPYDLLSSTLHNFAKSINHGWLLLAFDSSEDSKEITAYYTKHALFQLNVFDRMAAELSIEGDFDPKAFDYVARWHASSSQLGHMAVLNRPLHFTIDGETFSLSAGQALHLKNSFKFPDDFFELCCVRADLSIIQRWALADSRYYLLAKPPAPSR